MAKPLGRDREPGGGLASSADRHLLQTSRNVSVASTTFTTRGAERLWGALMDCKRLFPLCLLGSSPIPSGTEPHSGACAGTGAVGTRQGRLCLHLLASAPWSCCSVGSTRFGKRTGSGCEPAMIKASDRILPISSMDLMPCARNELHLQLCVPV